MTTVLTQDPDELVQCFPDDICGGPTSSITTRGECCDNLIDPMANSLVTEFEGCQRCPIG